MAIKPNFLTSMGYHIFLTMVRSFAIIFCLYFFRVFHCSCCGPFIHLPFRSFFVVIITILQCVALSLFVYLAIFRTAFWSTSLPFSQEVVSMTEKLDWQFSLPVNPGHSHYSMFSTDGSHSPWKSLMPFLFHSVFVGFIQIGFNHPLCLLYFHCSTISPESVLQSTSRLVFAVKAMTENVRHAASPVMKASRGVA